MSDRQNLYVADFEGIRSLDLHEFPVAEDFAIELIEEVSGSSIRFVAPRLDIVVRFPWWEDVQRQIAGWSLSDIPNGSIVSPYWDMDQGWKILIWQSGESIYVAQGGSVEGEYDDYFSLSVSLYRSEWDKVIRLAASMENEC